MAHNESLSLNPEKDRELIKWLSQQPSKSATIRAALYFYKAFGKSLDIPALARKLDKLPDVLQAIERIEQKIDSGVIGTSGDQERSNGLDILLNAIDEMEEFG